MSFFTAKSSQASQSTAVSGLQIQSSAYGKAIPMLYGTTLLAPNIIWYGDFTATPQSSPSAGKGGVGGGGGGKGGGGTGQYTYSTSFEMALCEGPVSKVGSVYVDKNISSLSSLGLSLFTGAYGQAPWGYLVSKAVPTTETHTVPASAPYTITLSGAANFLSDNGVTTSAVRFTRAPSRPLAPGQYATQISGNNALYAFFSTDIGKNVAISYSSTGVATKTVQATIPSSLVIQVPTSIGFVDQGVIVTGSVYSFVSGVPAAGQYAQTLGTYTFSAANAGATVNISYYTVDSTGPALGYSGIAYLAAAAYGLGNSPQLPNHNFEVFGNPAFLANGTDADPSLVVNDYLTNPHYGVGFPSSRMGDLTTYRNYTLACGLWISPAYTDQAQASSTLDDIATATNSAFVWSSGVLNLVPYGDQNVTGNGYTYTAPSAPLYDLTDDDFLPNTNATAGSASSNADPVLLTRKRPSDALNSIQIEVLDRSNYYNPAIIEAKDQALIQTFGLRSSSSSQMHMFCDLTAGRLSAQLQLQRQAIRNIYQFTLDQRYVLLDPMDIVTITDSYLGLNKQWVRITEITENDDKSLSFVAEEYLQGTGHAPAYSFQTAGGFNADYNASPSGANQPVIFEPTAELAEALEVWLAASGGPLWGGCDVWTSNDGDTYKLQGRITGSARTGVLQSTLPSVAEAATGQTIDSINTFGVDLTQSNGELISASQDDALSLKTLCFVDGEYVSYQNVSLIDDFVYDLSYLVRGVYGSPIGSHNAGSQLARLDDGIFKVPFNQSDIGSTIYIKLLSYNIYGGGQEQLSDIEPYAYEIQGTAYTSQLPDVTNLRTSYVAGITQLAWDEISDFRPVFYEVRKGASFQSGQQLGRVAHPPFNVQGNGTYWVAAYSQPVPALQVYSDNPQFIDIAGAQIVSNVIASFDEAASGWKGAVSGTAVVNDGFVQTSGAGSVLAIADYLNTPDILNYGGQGNGIYEIPVSHHVNIGRVAPCSVIITWTSVAQHFGDNILTVGDYLNEPDILDFAASGNTDIYPEIALSQDGVTWGDWQKYTAGSYIAKAYKARAQLITYDPTVEAILEDFIFEVDVPDRDDHYTNVSVPAGGLAIVFTPDGSSIPAPFNGGPQGSPTVPAVQVTILNAQAGDDVIVSSLSLAGCTIRVTNSGFGVARTVSALVEGY